MLRSLSWLGYDFSLHLADVLSNVIVIITIIIITIIIIIIVVIIIIVMCDPLQFSGIFWVFSAMSQRLPTQYTFRKKWAVPSMADNYICTSKNVRQTLNLPYPALALFVIVPSAPFTIGIIVTFVALWILLISSARSWNLSTFSSAERVLWSADTRLCR